MPTYEYRCKSCGHELEVQQRFTDDALTECPACAGPLRKVFGNVGIAFKGDGFYKTDSRSKSASKSESSSSDKSSDSKPAESTPSESKPASKPAEPASVSS